MAPSTDSSVSSPGSEEEGKETEDLDCLLVGGLSFLDFVSLDLDTDLLEQSAEENHLEAVEGPTDPRTAERHEQEATGPEVRWLANLYRNIQLQQGHASVRSIEDIIQLILTRFVPQLREHGFTGACTDDLIGNFNASLRRQPPLVPLASKPVSTKESSTNSSPPSKTDKWKMKNRPSGLKYKERKRKGKNKKKKKQKKATRKPKAKAQDVSGGDFVMNQPLLCFLNC